MLRKDSLFILKCLRFLGLDELISAAPWVFVFALVARSVLVVLRLVDKHARKRSIHVRHAGVSDVLMLKVSLNAHGSGSPV